MYQRKYNNLLLIYKGMYTDDTPYSTQSLSL